MNRRRLRKIRSALLALLLGPMAGAACLDASAAPPVTFGGGIRRVLDEGSYVVSPGAIDCIGAGITCAASGNTVTFTVSGGVSSAYDTVQEEGVNVTQRSTLNFVGAALTAADSASKTAITLSASPDSASVVGTGRTLTAGTCVSAIGDLSANRTIGVDTTAACAPTWAGDHTFTPFITATAGIRVGDGVVGTPAIAFANDTNTGIYSATNDQINMATSGAVRFTLDANSLVIPVDIDGDAGSSSDPGITFGDADTGIYASSGGTLNIANQGNQTVRFFSNNTTAFSGDTSVGNGKLMVKTHTGFTESEWNMDTACITTTDATVTNLYTRTGPSNNRMQVFDVLIGAMNTTTNTESAIYRRQFKVENAGGTVTAGTITALGDDEDDAAWDATVDISGTSPRVRATGEAGQTIRWCATIRWQEIGGA